VRCRPRRLFGQCICDSKHHHHHQEALKNSARKAPSRNDWGAKIQNSDDMLTRHRHLITSYKK